MCMKKEDIAPPGYRIYPESSPEFCFVKDENGDLRQYVRYINVPVGYTGKWMLVETKEIEN